jgi:hypothetical protein
MCLNYINTNDMILIDGTRTGVKSKIGKPILLDDLMSEDFLNVDDNDLYGILIPRDELLSRKHYNWFVTLQYEDAIETRTVLSKYMKASVVDSERHSWKITKSLVSI